MYYSPVKQMSYPKKRNIIVYGNRFVAVEPNMVEMQLGVMTFDRLLEKAQQQNASISGKVIDSITKLMVPREYIQTIQYTIYPKYDYVDNEQQFKGYEVAHMLKIKNKNIHQTGIIIDTAVQNGANRVSEVIFTISDEERYYQQALTLAVEDAYRKAQTIAAAMQVMLEPIPIKVTEQSNKQSSFPNVAVSSVEVGSITTPIEHGRLHVEANIEVEFSF